MDGQMTFEFAQRPTIKGFPELKMDGQKALPFYPIFPSSTS